MLTEPALARLRLGDTQGALALLDALGGTDDPAPLTARGMALLADHRPAEALVALRRAVALGDTMPPTLLNLALAEDAAGDAGRAGHLMVALANRLPDWDEPRLRLAERARAAGDIAAAIRDYEAVLEINPARPEALVGLAALRIGLGEAAQAQGLLLRCCGLTPDRAEAWDALGFALTLSGDLLAAESAFARAQTLAPHRFDYGIRRAESALRAGNGTAERARLEVAAMADPLDAVTLTALGVLLEHLGERASAIDALEAAATLAPEAVAPVAALGGLLARAHRLEEAERALRRAGELDPTNAIIQNDLAAVLMRRYRHAEARNLLNDLLARYGRSVPLLCNLVNATVALGLQDEALAMAREARALDPDSSLAWRTLSNALPYHQGVDAAALLDSLRATAARLKRAPAAPFTNRADPDRRLRLGLLSGSLRAHPVGWLTIAGFETLDPAAFELVCLVQNAATDPIARRFRSIAATWHDIDTLDDATLAELTRTLGIDVLIDLGGYGDSGRMTACARRLAPVQVKWVGMQNHSTGIAEMDWFITDRFETPPGFEPLYSERLLRLPDGYVCYSPPPYAPDVTALPALANGHLTFACFNNLAKITPQVIATWAEILRRLPDARLVLKTHQFADPATCERLREAFAAHAIDPARLDMRGSSSHREFLRQLGEIDIVLDPFPYSGGLTTCEALWMGVPTVSLPGRTFASRHTFSHQSNAGLSGWDAADPDAYIRLAIARAGDLAGLAALRAGLRRQVKTSPLCDAPRFGRHLGAALRAVWQDWCARA